MIQAPLDAQLLVLQLLFEILLQWNNIKDALVLQTLKCSLTSCSTLVDDEKTYNFKTKKQIHVLKQNNYSFCQCVN